ncbi:hypothetical protein GT028_05375 [Streptomyces sp. SID2999]|nr:hypothetical protein [Streptomyces sp. SID2999]MYZ06804.1 hypothetical protein [Streptomyces sp. SID2999]
MQSASPAEKQRFAGALPPPAVCGFLVLLALVFAGSYLAGASAGPVAPGMHGNGVSRPGTTGHQDGPDMGGMDMDHGSGR